MRNAEVIRQWRILKRIEGTPMPWDGALTRLARDAQR